MEGGVYTYANVRRWTNRPSKVNVFECDKIIMPINVGNVRCVRLCGCCGCVRLCAAVCDCGCGCGAGTLL